MNERELIQRVDEADAPEFARILRNVSAEEARALSVHFGEEVFERMRTMALAGAGATRRTAQGNVIVLHGILGAELTLFVDGFRQKAIWVSVRRLILGGFQKLALEMASGAARVEATGILKKYYGEQLLRLNEHGWNARAFWYDWRLDIDEIALRLKNGIEEWSSQWVPGQPVHLVAHSMGGLVARSFIRQNQAMWNDMGGKLVMLGTPNNGSFNAPQLFSGFNSVLKMVNLLDIGRGMDAQLRVVRTFPSAFQLLPNPHYLQTDTDRGVWSHERYVMQLEAAKFEQAAKFWREITPIADPERMIYVAGANQPTAVGVRDLGLLGSMDGYDYSMAGDGTVPHRLGLLHTPDGTLIPTYYADCEHGAMPNDALIGEGVEELLRRTGQGKLRTEPQLRPLERGLDDHQAARIEASEKEARWSFEAQITVASLVTRGDVKEEEVEAMPLTETEREAEELLVQGFLTANDTRGGRRTAVPKASHPAAIGTPVATVRLDVEHVDIRRDFDWPGVDAIAVGHYTGVMPSASEGALSDAISATNEPEASLLGEFTRRGIIHGALGEVFIVPDMRRAERLVLLAGMGFPGQFSHVELRSCVRQLLWTACRLKRKHLATVLIGAGEGNVPYEMAVTAWLSAIEDMLTDATLRQDRLSRISFCEYWPSRTRLLRRTLDEAVTKLGLAGRVDVSPETPELRVLLDQEIKTEIERRLERELNREEAARASSATSRITTTYAAGCYRFSALTNAASIPEREIHLDKPLVDEANNKFPILTHEKQRGHGRFFKRLLLPEEFDRVLRTPDPLVVVCDATTATLHWEMMAMPDAVADVAQPMQGFLGVDRGLTRQFKSSFAPVGTRQSLTQGPICADGILRVLIVIDPAQDRRLPAAEKEGNAVAKFFFRLSNEWSKKHKTIKGIDVRVLHGPSDATRLRVLEELMTSQYDILHFAGHCVYDRDNPMRSGWIFTGDARLTANELRRIGQAPSFIFSNACESGITPDRSELRHANLAATFAESFFAQGVQNFVCTAWPVNDEAARVFAETFYEECFQRGADGRETAKPIYEAMCAARRKVMTMPEGGRTWGAYQHYGDPHGRLF